MSYENVGMAWAEHSVWAAQLVENQEKHEKNPAPNYLADASFRLKGWLVNPIDRFLNRCDRVYATALVHACRLNDGMNDMAIAAKPAGAKIAHDIGAAFQDNTRAAVRQAKSTYKVGKHTLYRMAGNDVCLALYASEQQVKKAAKKTVTIKRDVCRAIANCCARVADFDAQHAKMELLQAEMRINRRLTRHSARGINLAGSPIPA